MNSCWSFYQDSKHFQVNTIVTQEYLFSAQYHHQTSLTDKYFRMMGNNIGCVTLVENEIIVGKIEPIRQRAHRVSPDIQEIIVQEVKTMLKDDITEPVLSHWASHVIMVSKKDGRSRFWVDFRKINKITTKEAYPIPSMPSILDR